MLERLSETLISKNIPLKFPTPLPLYNNAPKEIAKTEWVKRQLPEIQDIAQKIVDHINHIPFQLFLQQLRLTISDFNAKVKEPYILCIYTGQGESDLWVAQLALEHGNLERLPAAIVNAHQLNDYLNQFSHIKHVLMLDDCAYSGMHMCDAISTVRQTIHYHEAHLYLGIPYITSYAKQQFDYRNLTLLRYEDIPLLAEVLTDDERTRLEYYGFKCLRQTLTYFDHCAGDAISLLPCLADGSNLFRLCIFRSMHALGYYIAERKNSEYAASYTLTTPVETPEKWNQLVSERFPASQPIIPKVFKPYCLVNEAKEFKTALTEGRLGRRNSHPSPADLKDLVPRAEPSLSAMRQVLHFKERTSSLDEIKESGLSLPCVIL